MILITGASGTAGGAVLEAARAASLPLRAMYRSDSDAARAPARVPSVIADFAHPASLARALDGIDRVFLVCGPIPDLVELEGNMIEACRAAGVRHLVLNSALGAGRFPKSFPSWHMKVEAKLKESGLGHTILRPNGFMQNIALYDAPSIRAQNAFYGALGEARVSLIDVRDVGAAAATILANPAPHAGQTYELNGPEAVSPAEIAARLSRAAGRPIAYVDIPVEKQREAMLGAGMPDWQVTAILELQEYYRSGACAAVDDVLPRLLGHPARTLDAYLRENLSAFAAEAA